MSGRLKIAAVLTLLALLAFPAAAGSTPRTSAESSLLREINRVRSAHGLHALRYDARLAAAARAHTRAMVAGAYFAHGAFAARMERFHVLGPVVAENLAWGTGVQGTPAALVAAWLQSPPHRRNLLRPGFRRIGIGVSTGTFAGLAGASVATADFAGA